MKITVNGVTTNVFAGTTIATFIAERGLHSKAVVVEHNYDIIKQEQLNTVILKTDDNLEIVTFVGGG